jgi:hypothetical protein
MAKADPVLDALQKTTKGLLFPSETDAPIEPFVWPTGPRYPTEESVRACAKVADETPIEQVALATLTRTIPEESREEFAPLLAALDEHLSGVKVFKVGEINMDVYIVGRTDDGRFAGVKTKVVET